VLNNFLSKDPSQTSIPKHLEQLSTSVFQSLFPAISPQTTPLSSIRRVLLVNREPDDSSADSHSPNGTYRLTLRHFAIITRVTSVPKALRRLEIASKSSSSSKSRSLPNLGKLEDVADYLLDPEVGNYTSGSESEVETDAEVEVLEEGSRKVIGRRKPLAPGTIANGTGDEHGDASKHKGHGVKTKAGTRRVEKRAVKLVELGPRLSLRLTKVEEGLCSGKVMWHESVQKTREEEKDLDQKWEERNREKERRKQEQRANVERKRQQKVQSRGDEAKGADGNDAEEDEDEDEEMADWDLSDDEWDDGGGGVDLDVRGGKE
jgi:ribosome biogenesis protein SSF1/2